MIVTTLTFCLSNPSVLQYLDFQSSSVPGISSLPPTSLLFSCLPFFYLSSLFFLYFLFLSLCSVLLPSPLFINIHIFINVYIVYVCVLIYNNWQRISLFKKEKVLCNFGATWSVSEIPKGAKIVFHKKGGNI